MTSGLSPEMLLTGNPSNSWVKRAFVMDDDGAFIDPLPHRRRVLFTVADNPDAAVRVILRRAEAEGLTAEKVG